MTWKNKREKVENKIKKETENSHCFPYNVIWRNIKEKGVEKNNNYTYFISLKSDITN